MSGNAGYHRVFWLTTAFTVVVIVIAVFVVPRRPRSRHRDDRLARRGRAWRRDCRRSCCRSPRGSHGAGRRRRRSAARAGGVVVLVGWWMWERRAKQPLVSTEMLTRRPILLTNLATVFVGMGLYFAFLGLTQFVQIPKGGSGLRLRRDGTGGQRGLPAARAWSPAFSSRCSAAGSSTASALARCSSSPPSRGSPGSCSSPSPIRRRGRSSSRASWPTPTSASATGPCPRWWSARSTPARRGSPRA